MWPAPVPVQTSPVVRLKVHPRVAVPRGAVIGMLTAPNNGIGGTAAGVNKNAYVCDNYYGVFLFLKFFFEEDW